MNESARTHSGRFFFRYHIEMQRFSRQFAALVSLLAFTTIYLNGTRVFTPPSANSTYLSNLNYSAVNGWQAAVFGGRNRWDSLDTYRHLVGEYDEKRAYGLLNAYDEAGYSRRFSDLAASALHDLESFHTRAYGKHFANQLSEELNVRALIESKSPLLIFGALAAVYTGRVIRYTISAKMILETRSSFSRTHFTEQYLGWRHRTSGTSIGTTFGGLATTISMSQQVTPELALTYDKRDEHSVGVRYTQGF